MSNRPPSLLILAASTYQLPFIRRAKEKGLRVITLDNRPANPGHALADRAIHASTTDAAAVTTAAREESVSGILAPCTDVALPALARACATLGLPGPSPKAADTLTSKIAFRQTFPGLSGVDSCFAPAPPDLPDPSWNHWPAIVKPDRASGAKGITIIQHASELPAALEAARQASVNQAALVEPFHPGSQHTCEAIWDGQRLAAAWFFDRLTAPPPFATTLGHQFPSRLEPADQEKVAHLVTKVLQDLNLPPSFVDVDFVAGPRLAILEIGPRPGGNSIGRLLGAAVGLDVPGLAIDLALGKPLPALPQNHQHAAALHILGSTRAGTLHYAPEKVSVWREREGIAWLELDLPPGSRVEAIRESRHRFGELLALGRDVTAASVLAEEAIRGIGCEVVP